MLKKVLSVFAMLVLYSVGLTLNAADWVAENEKDGIKVYTRIIEGSSVKEFKGETVVNANYKAVNTIIDDVAKLDNWMADTGDNFVVYTFNVKPNGSKEMYLVNITTAPMGVSYRYSLVYSKVVVTDQQIIRTIELTQPSQLPAAARQVYDAYIARLPITKNGSVLSKSKINEMVAVAELNGKWIIDKIDENHTRVTYTVKVNPGGYIPLSLVNAATKSNPYKTLKGLKTQIK